jgi:transposase
VFDIPPLSIYVTEYQREIKRCIHCGKIAKSNFPDGLVQEAQYGPRIKGLVSYLKENHIIPYARGKEFIRDVFNHELSTGTINNFLRSCYAELEAPEASVKECLLKSKNLHVDETGMRLLGKSYWHHVASTEEYTYYGMHEKRGKEALEAMDILPNYKGNLVHDFFRTYLQYGTGHILCNAHLLRELTYIDEEEKQKWAKHMKDLLLAIKKQREYLKDQGISSFPHYRIAAYEKCYAEIIMMGLWHPDNIAKESKRRKQTKAKNLLDRLRFHRDKILAYMYDFDAPFTNNQAERDLRMSKVTQKVSGCFRSKTGADYFCRIRGYISTARKNGIQILDALEQAFMHRPFIPETSRMCY